MTFGTFRARIGDKAYDIVLDESGVRLDGEPIDVSFERVSGDYFAIQVEGESYSAELAEDGDVVRVTNGGHTREVFVQDRRSLLLERYGLTSVDAGTVREIRAPMPGLVVRVLVAPGQTVRSGEGLVVLEAMKMENELCAHADGKIAAVHAGPGDAVGKNALLVELE